MRRVSKITSKDASIWYIPQSYYSPISANLFGKLLNLCEDPSPPGKGLTFLWLLGDSTANNREVKLETKDIHVNERTNRKALIQEMPGSDWKPSLDSALSKLFVFFLPLQQCQLGIECQLREVYNRKCWQNLNSNSQKRVALIRCLKAKEFLRNGEKGNYQARWDELEVGLPSLLKSWGRELNQIMF